MTYTPAAARIVQITLADYLMGRQRSSMAAFTPMLANAAEQTVARVNLLLRLMQADGVAIEDHPEHGSPVSSGWRTLAVNAATPGAAPRSKHLTCEACDLWDPEGVLDDWCMSHPDELADVRLWLEHPAATKGWCHVQIVAPRSGQRVFYP